MGLFKKCDSCGLVSFSGKERVINGTKLFLCQHCFRTVVAVSALADLKILDTEKAKLP